MPIIFQTQTAGHENANDADENNLSQTWPDWYTGGNGAVLRMASTDVNNIPGQLEITVEASPAYSGGQVIRGLSDFDNMINPDNHRIQFYSNFGQALGQQQTYDEIWWGVWIYWNTYIKAEDGGQGQGWAQIYESISNPNNNYDATALFLKSNAGYTANILEAFVNYRNVGSSGIVSQRGTTELPLQQWFHLEARVRFRNDNTGQFQVWINGVEEFNLSGRTQDAASDWSYLNPVQLYGQKTGAGTMGEALVYWDDVIVADERIWTMEGYGNGGGGNGQILPPPAARRMIGLVPMGLR